MRRDGNRSAEKLKSEIAGAERIRRRRSAPKLSGASDGSRSAAGDRRSATNLGHVAEILIRRAAGHRRGRGYESFAGNSCVFYLLRA